MKDSFEATVRAISSEGFGVVDHPNGKIFFVPEVWKGDQGRFEVVDEKSKYGTARLVELKNGFDGRRPSPCVHFGFEAGQCGGCPWIFVPYEQQLIEKQSKVEQQLLRHEIVDSKDSIKQIWGAPNEFSFRNRAQFKTDGKRIGYVTPRTNTLAPIENCMILNSKMQSLFEELKSTLPREDWIPDQSRPWRFVDVDDSIDSVEQIVSSKKLSFRQGNTEQNEAMRKWLAEQTAPLNKQSSVLELFCGDGNFTQVLADQGFEKIIAVEVGREAVQRLQKKNLKPVKAFSADLMSSKIWHWIEKNAGQPTLLVMDPPRIGFKGIRGFLNKLKTINRIIYISCSLSDFCRDAHAIQKLGFGWIHIQPVDQFPQTPHIELLAVAERSE